MLQVNGVDSKALLNWVGVGVVLLSQGRLTQAVETNNALRAFSREQVEFYEKKVQPILEQNCYKCHSHQAEKIKGGLVLDSRDGLLKGLNLDATIELAESVSIPVIASGGFASIEDVKALLSPRAKKLAGAIAGRALYDGRLDSSAALALIRNARAAA